MSVRATCKACGVLPITPPITLDKLNAHIVSKEHQVMLRMRDKVEALHLQEPAQ